MLSSAANRTVRLGEPWTHQLSAVRTYMRFALSAGSYASKYVGGFVFSKGHRGDPAAAEPMVPVDPTQQRRALELAMQIITQARGGA